MGNNENDIAIPREAWVVSIVLLAVAVAAVVYVSRGVYDHPTGEFVGPNRCRECHEEIYQNWVKTRMATTFHVLKPGAAVEQKKIAGLDPEADYTHEETCLACHTTGYGLTGGFVSIEATPDLAGVTCEACHGPGGGYAGNAMSRATPNFATEEARREGLVYPPTEEVCRKCHNENSPFVDANYVFDFKTRVERGTHQHHPLKYRHDGAGTDEAEAGADG